jgi:hypothetical protein
MNLEVCGRILVQFLLGEKEQNYKICRAVALCIEKDRELENKYIMKSPGLIYLLTVY